MKDTVGDCFAVFTEKMDSISGPAEDKEPTEQECKKLPELEVRVHASSEMSLYSPLLSFSSLYPLLSSYISPYI